MGQSKNMIIEAKVLYKLQRGSYEELLQALDQAVSENQEMFGDSEAVLFASHVGSIVVMNEDGGFFSVKYANKDGVVLLKESKALDVGTVSENEIASSGIDQFFDGKSLAESLRDLVNIREIEASDSAVSRVRDALSKLFAGGQIWRKHVEEHKQRIGAFAWDADYGSVKIDVRPVFGDIADGSETEFTEDLRGEILTELLSLERRLYESLARTKDAFEAYYGQTSGMHDEETGETLVRFEGFASDYIDHLTEVTDFVSSSVCRGEGGEIVCAAIVYDEVALRFKELELGGRFIRKVSAQFVQ
jgi:hypothetical protein